MVKTVYFLQCTLDDRWLQDNDDLPVSETTKSQFDLLHIKAKQDGACIEVRTCEGSISGFRFKKGSVAFLVKSALFFNLDTLLTQ